MTFDTFIDTFTLVRNSLEKQDTQFREAFPTEKRVAIAFRISHQRCSMKKSLRTATLLKKKTLAQVFSCEFCEISKNTFFTEHLWTTPSECRNCLYTFGCL